MSATKSDKGIWKRALWLVPLVVIGGSLSGVGFGPDAWYAALEKPSFQPPAYLFGIVWPALYTMIALALATVLNEPRTPARDAAVGLWGIQLLLNFSWSYVFFGAHAIAFAKWHLAAILVVAALAAGRFWRIRPLAGWLMVPYLLWLIFAFMLNSAIVELNPGVSEPLFG
ncbi:TspO/MBR family protein [Sphingomicrobium astaxanthinifaciens]|uniref:TspO/MBR family protein n=1 Tax=Sphingomicrobium astaxanthinifaciens TaxID=1227949 RepID=UPI001FCCB916|nr:TspO/MBR family protein [Sphingomicrobium astaxanthinifaciens]MCJ7420460.1 tryptophan-rich sensory protein [Sphingomicrobium astaxanthinifaciens]